MAFLENALMCIYKKVKLVNHDCLPILMLLYIMLYVMLYIMLFAALYNAVCLYNAYNFALDICKCFLFSCFFLVFLHIVYLFQILFCIMPSALNLLVFLILCSHHFFM